MDTEIEIRIDELERVKKYVQDYLLEMGDKDFRFYDVGQFFDNRISDLRTFGIDVKSRIW